METIFNFSGKNNEVTNVEFFNNYERDDLFTVFLGYFITTETDEYLFMIDNQQDCCENYGVEISPVDFDMLGKHLIKITCREECTQFGEYKLSKICELFFSDDTKCELTIYNEHNGYYPHKYLIEFENYKDSEMI